MIENTTVSIIMPSYNSRKYILESIESVIQQTYKQWELIIIDDCSKDGSIAMIEEIAKSDNRIKLLYNHENKGVAETRNRGIEHSAGRFLAFLDSDDIWYHNKLELQVDLMIRESIGFSYTSYEFINSQSKSLKKIIRAEKSVNYKKLLFGNVIGCLTVIIDKNKIIISKMPNIGHEDYAMWLTILKSNNIEAFGLPNVLAKYRKTKESISSNKIKTLLWTWNIYRNNQNINFFKSILYIAVFIVKGIKKNLLF